MSQIFIPETDPILAEVLAAYEFPATLLGAVRYGHGHINDTFCVICQPQEGDAIRFILQGLSLAAFPRQAELMENFVGITSFLREKITASGVSDGGRTGLTAFTAGILFLIALLFSPLLRGDIL